MTDWAAHRRREEARYRDGVERLPAEPDARQRQLTRVANAAYGAGLAALMDGDAAATAWLARAAERYRESYEDAPPDSWGRPIGSLKARILAEDWDGALAAAGWTLDEGAERAESPVGRYAACLALIVADFPEEAARLAAGLGRDAADFPSPVAEALASLAVSSSAGFDTAVRAVLESFEHRDEYLEDVPVADTVLVLQALARRRGLAAPALRSALLPG